MLVIIKSSINIVFFLILARRATRAWKWGYRQEK